MHRLLSVFIVINVFLLTDTSQDVPRAAYSNTQQKLFKRQVQSVEYKCGVPVLSPNALIVQGEYVNHGEYPWLVAIFVIRENNLVFQCGGALISDLHVLTAAHCTFDKNPYHFLLKLGLNGLHDWETDHIRLMRVRSVQYHPEYIPERFLDRDIAIMIMKRPVKYTQYIIPVCLWEGSDDLSEIVGQRATVAGWGRSERSLVVFPRLKKITVPIVSTDVCKASKPDFHYFTNDKTLCAGDRDGTGPCNGDSGGGLFMKKGDRWMIRGIVSNSLKSESDTCDLNEYVIFTDAAKYIQWIRNVVDVCKATCYLNSCVLPESPTSGYYSVISGGSNSTEQPTIVMEQTVLLYVCYEGSLTKDVVTICVNGNWSKIIQCRGGTTSTIDIDQPERENEKNGPCRTNEGVRGTCKVSSDCPSAFRNQRVTGRPTLCGFEGSVAIICCTETRNSTTRPTTSRPLEPTTVDNAPSIRKSVEMCTKYTKSVMQVEPKCIHNRNPLILGGEDAFIGEFPHMAAIFYEDRLEGKFSTSCGGTLISENYVMTAAQCTYSRALGTPVKVRLGDVNLESDKDNVTPQDIDIESVIPHPDYKYPLKYHDIGLLKLSTPARFNELVRPACLWTTEDITSKKALATGWGQTVHLDGKQSAVLQKVTLDIIPQEQCAARPELASAKSYPKGIIREQMCAGDLQNEGRDTCQGDGGGPLQITDPNNKCIFYVIGITSFGIGCGRPDTPAVYTRVSAYLDWIERTVWP